MNYFFTLTAIERSSPSSTKLVQLVLYMLECADASHRSWSDFFCDKKKQRNCTRESFLGVLLILKTLTYKSGIEGLKSYPIFSLFLLFLAYSGLIFTQPGPERPRMTLKHFTWVYYMIWCHVGPPWGHSGTHGGPKMAQNSTKIA